VVEETWKEREKDTEGRLTGEYAPLARAPRIRDQRNIEDVEGEGLKEEKIESYRYTISDNPGLLPQAAENVGLGHSFLRSIERSLALAYVLDIARPNPEEDLLGLRGELETYKEGLAGKAAVVILNKGDEVDAEMGRVKVAAVRKAVAELEEGQGGRIKVLVLSGKYGLGLDKLVKIMGERVEEVRQEMAEADEVD